MLDVKVGDVLEGIVSDLASGGEGVVKMDRYPIFVPFAIEGETVRVRVTFVKKDCAFGELLQVLQPSPCRVKPACPYFGRCGGCDIQHMDLDLQRIFKRDCVYGAFKKIAGMIVDAPMPIGGAPLGYRNKLALPFAKNKVSGRVSLGFYERRSHRLVPIKFCPACGEWTGDLIETLTTWANEFEISVYDENSGKGLLRHAVARMLDTLSLTLVVSGDDIPHLDELERRLESKFAGVCLYVSQNKRSTNVILGEGVELVYGEEKPQELGKFKAKISPRSFLQVNREVMELLYDGVAAALDGFDGDIVELYSGVGLLTAQLATRLDSSIVAVEIESSATRDAEALMRELGLEERVKCVNCDAMKFMSELEGDGRKRALVLDPPRKGCAREVLERAIEAGFDRIVYVSCEPLTLARDASVLMSNYELKNMSLYDMFPNTANVETLCVFEKNNKR